MAGVAAVDRSNAREYAACWQERKGKLQRALGSANFSRLQPMFQQVRALQLACAIGISWRARLQQTWHTRNTLTFLKVVHTQCERQVSGRSWLLCNFSWMTSINFCI